MTRICTEKEKKVPQHCATYFKYMKVKKCIHLYAGKLVS